MDGGGGGTGALFPFPPTSLKHELYGLMSGFTRLVMKIKYVCNGLISLHVSFHGNRTKWTLTSNIKICRWGGGGGGKRAETGKEPSELIRGRG